MAFTDTDVRSIAPSIASTLSITGWITTARIIVDKMQAASLQTFTDTEIDQIGIYLSAHLVFISPGSGVDGTAKSESIAKGDYSRTMNVATLGDGIMGSEYGQMANMLSNGELQSMDQPQPGLYSIGSSNAD